MKTLNVKQTKQVKGGCLDFIIWHGTIRDSKPIKLAPYNPSLIKTLLPHETRTFLK